MSSPVKMLSVNNFSLVGTKKKALAVDIERPTLVWFKLPPEKCPRCAEFQNVWGQLVRLENRVVFGMCDLDGNNRNIVQMSKDTSTPLTGVPKLIFYFGGLPYAIFQGQRNLQSIQAFIGQAISKAQEQTQTVPQNNIYGGQSKPSQRTYQPDLPPKLPRQARTIGSGGYNLLGGAEDSEENVLLVPTVFNPFNKPWAIDNAGGYKNVGE